ncbi:hypothetical protein V5799_015804 [Amblyomma americanum]|uniref:Uncharacterized protein n=1 Tax=Amblyomma americanum TaxID=6943 RepID=A0AAQ4F7Y4_AMBAM
MHQLCKSKTWDSRHTSLLLRRLEAWPSHITSIVHHLDKIHRVEHTPHATVQQLMMSVWVRCGTSASTAARAS